MTIIPDTVKRREIDSLKTAAVTVINNRTRIIPTTDYKYYAIDKRQEPQLLLRYIIAGIDIQRHEPANNRHCSRTKHTRPCADVFKLHMNEKYSLQCLACSVVTTTYREEIHQPLNIHQKPMGTHYVL